MSQKTEFITALLASPNSGIADCLSLMKSTRRRAAKYLQQARTRRAKHLQRFQESIRASAWNAGRLEIEAYKADVLRNLNCRAEAHLDLLTVEALELSLKVAKTVIASTVPEEISGLAQRIRVVYSTIEMEKKVTLDVNSSQLTAVNEECGDLINLKIGGTSKLPLGCAHFRNESGTFDLDWEYHFTALAKKLRSKLKALSSRSFSSEAEDL